MKSGMDSRAHAISPAVESRLKGLDQAHRVLDADSDAITASYLLVEPVGSVAGEQWKDDLSPEALAIYRTMLYEYSMYLAEQRADLDRRMLLIDEELLGTYLP